MKTIRNCFLAPSEAANTSRDQSGALRVETPGRLWRPHVAIHIATTLFAACAVFAVAACSSSDSNPSTSAAGSGGTTAATGTGGSTMTGGGGGADGGNSSVTAQFAAHFDP